MGHLALKIKPFRFFAAEIQHTHAHISSLTVLHHWATANTEGGFRNSYRCRSVISTTSRKCQHMAQQLQLIINHTYKAYCTACIFQEDKHTSRPITQYQLLVSEIIQCDLSWQNKAKAYCDLDLRYGFEVQLAWYDLKSCDLETGVCHP